MGLLARRNLFHDKVRCAVTLTGIAFCAGAYGDERFRGTVIRVAGILGRKTIRTDQPSEHVDAKMLETLVELVTGRQLPLGLRVDPLCREIDSQGPAIRSGR